MCDNYKLRKVLFIDESYDRGAIINDTNTTCTRDGHIIIYKYTPTEDFVFKFKNGNLVYREKGHVIYYKHFLNGDGIYFGPDFIT